MVAFVLLKALRMDVHETKQLRNLLKGENIVHSVPELRLPRLRLFGKARPDENGF